MKEMILAFGCEEIYPLLQRTFAPQRMSVKAVSTADLTQKIAVLAGVAGYERTDLCCEEEKITEPMLVFCGFYGNRMNLALQAMRRTGLRIPYKAMLTKSNQDWKPAQLLKELKAEHEALEQGKRVHD